MKLVIVDKLRLFFNVEQNLRISTKVNRHYRLHQTQFT